MKNIASALIVAMLIHNGSALAQSGADRYKVKAVTGTGSKNAVLSLESTRLSLRASGVELKAIDYTDIKAAEYSYPKSPGGSPALPWPLRPASSRRRSSS